MNTTDLTPLIRQPTVQHYEQEARKLLKAWRGVMAALFNDQETSPSGKEISLNVLCFANLNFPLMPLPLFS
jgi:hypothetical protein